jgi:DNA-binding transcriptional MerR regulator
MVRVVHFSQTKESRVKVLTIGQVARSAGVGVETVRFYEREGLLAEPTRRPSGYRQYEENDQLQYRHHVT